MDKYRILSMDGSSMTGGNGFVTAGLLQGMQASLKSAAGSPALLDNVFMFAGTSAGAFNALFLAKWQHPDEALPHILEFWRLLMNANNPLESLSACRMAGALTGQNAFLSTARLHGFFRDYFGNMRLGDLKQKVLISSLQLDHGRGAARTWKPKIYNNFHNERDNDLKVTDVAMRSSSPPLITPVYQGYVDGGVVANNPAMLAIAQVLHERQPVPGDLDPLRKILMLSIGNAKVPHYLDPGTADGMADWGYSEWLLNLRDPLVMVTMLMDASVVTINYEAHRLLGECYFRLDPLLAKPLGVTNGREVAPAVQKFMADPVTQSDLERATAWFETSGWVEGAEPQGNKPSEPSDSHHGKRKKH
jgi:patatin-like phospholipase/acyl hydrolase